MVLANCTFIFVSAFCIYRTALPASCTHRCRNRQTVRTARIWSGGRNEFRNSPQVCSFSSHWHSCTSLFRPALADRLPVQLLPTPPAEPPNTSRGLHRYRADAARLQPFRHLSQSCRPRPELTHWLWGPVRWDRHKVAFIAHIDAGRIRMHHRQPGVFRVEAPLQFATPFPAPLFRLQMLKGRLCSFRHAILTLLGLARLSCILVQTLRRGRAKPPFRLKLATNSCNATTEVRLCGGHEGTKTLSTIACRPDFSSVVHRAPHRYQSPFPLQTDAPARQLCGQHRVLCGEATRPDAVARLLVILCYKMTRA